ncbi:PREDICTED: uncharacterized protein LOC109465244 [Branchiostoma belcheri]|uniref:Uncharacterized protein LOC109465244 n=1 Tax=Branchiostoma belcheri TaxID=7741 RepID=A0A6P4Y6I6_BRABE|nr:PREDICTED: uncharacterized protein LOC109465244 [Branchiostoma belcheri]
MWRKQVMTEQIFREDKEREKYRDVREGSEHGKLPFNRSKVLFVGDTWQGKTSLKRRLTGQEFNPHEGRTEGIQTKMVETQDVDQTWTSYRQTESDFSRSLTWYVKQRSKERPRTGATKDLSSLVKSALFYFLLSFLTVATLEFGSEVGYAVASLILTCTIAMMQLSSDFYHATRIASAIAVNSVFIGVMKNGVEGLYRSIGPVLSVGPFSLQGLVFCVAVTFVFCNTEGFVVFPFTFRIMHVMLCLVVPCPEFGAVGLLHFRTATTSTGHVLQDAFLYEPLGSVIGLTMFQFRHILITSKRGTFLSYLLFSLATIVLPVMITDERLEACMLMFLVGLHLGIGISCTIKAQKWLSSKMTAQYFWVVQLVSFPVQVATTLIIANLFGWSFYTLKDCPLSVLVAVAFFVSTDLYDKKSVFFNSEYVVVHDKLAEEKTLVEQVPVKLTLMDFAGDEDFYSMHHFFMAREAVYIVVFSLEEAFRRRRREEGEEDEEEATRSLQNTFRRLLFWLDSIDAHSSDTESLVFVVGTHRDSVSSAQQQEVATFLRTHLYTGTKYSARLVVNSTDTPYFPVENSAPLQDQDFARLRRVVWEKMRQVAYMKRECPIKWQRFSDVINTLRTNGDPHVVPYLDLLDKVRQEGILDDEDDFRRMLSFLNRSGQVIYRQEDAVLSQYVVVDPQVMVDAMKSITTLPRRCAELPTYRERHALLQAKGILDGDYLREVLNEVKPDHADVLTTLLVSHAFLCPLPQHPADKIAQQKQMYIVPPMLPRYEADQPGGFLEKHHDDDNVEYYIDFDSFEPSPVFYRLVAKLVCETDFRIRARGAPFVFRDRACFQLHRRFYFTLELVRPTTDQHLIQITVKKTTSTAADGQLIGELHGKLETIRRRDFPCLMYTIGPRCPHPPPHLGCSTEPGRMHVVEVVESGEEFPDTSQPLKLLCRDREVVVDMSRPRSRPSLQQPVEQEEPSYSLQVPIPERSFQLTAAACVGRRVQSSASTIVVQEPALPSGLLPQPDEHGLYDVTRWLQVAHDPTSALDNGECYPMWKKPRGDALIINNRDFVTMATRHGTDVDAENLERLFEALYFTTERWNNLRAPVMNLVLEDFAQRSHTQSQCCLVAILSHGGEDGVYSTDERLLSHADILRKFDRNNCPELGSKPKVFFMQACRGTDKDPGSLATDSGDTFRKDETAIPDTNRTFAARVPNLTDVYLAYSTTPGHVSWRDCAGGSWFIQVLVSVFLQYAATKDINQLMTKVNYEVSRRFESDKHHKQMPAPVNMLTKDLYFFPGWHH